MLEVKPNKEILKIKSSIYLGFTLYQIICFALGIVAGGAIFVLLPVFDMLKVFLMVFVVGIFSFAGFYEYNHMNIFQLLIAFGRCQKLKKQNLVVKNEERK